MLGTDLLTLGEGSHETDRRMLLRRGALRGRRRADDEGAVTRPRAVPVTVLEVGTLDEPTLFGAPQMAIYTVDKQPFHVIPEGMPVFERLPQRR